MIPRHSFSSSKSFSVGAASVQRVYYYANIQYQGVKEIFSSLGNTIEGIYRTR